MRVATTLDVWETREPEACALESLALARGLADAP
jgi:hypothetical protein